MLHQAIKALLLPPMPFLALAVAGVLLSRRRGDGAWWCAGVCVVALYLLATPVVAAALLRGVETVPPPLPSSLPAAQAIVVLSADDRKTSEYGGETVGDLTLVRLRYAARLQGRTGLPLLVSGGPLPGRNGTAAAEMAEVLEDDFKVPVAWREDRSHTTAENATFSAAMLLPHGIRRILLVTHAWHMARSRAAFTRAGFEVVPAPTAFTETPPLVPSSLLPSARALEASYFAVYEILGNLDYAATGAGER